MKYEMKRKYLQVDHEANFYAEYAIAIPPTSQKKQWEKKKNWNQNHKMNMYMRQHVAQPF